MALKVLRKNWQFQLVYRQGKKVTCKHTIIFYYSHHREKGDPHFGFVASKRIGNAVKRNRAKRRLREAFRQLANDLKYQKLWIIAIARPTILDAPHIEILTELHEKLAETGFLKDDA